MNASLDLVRVAGLLSNLDGYCYGFVGATCADLMEMLHAVNSLAILYVYDPTTTVKTNLHIGEHGHTVFAQRSLFMLVSKVDVVIVADAGGIGELHKLNLAGKAVVDLTGSLSHEDFDCEFYQVPGA